MVTGSGPQSKVMTPPRATAATTASEVQLAGVPLPITGSGAEVSTGPRLGRDLGAPVRVPEPRRCRWLRCRGGGQGGRLRTRLRGGLRGRCRDGRGPHSQAGQGTGVGVGVGPVTAATGGQADRHGHHHSGQNPPFTHGSMLMAGRVRRGAPRIRGRPGSIPGPVRAIPDGAARRITRGWTGPHRHPTGSGPRCSRSCCWPGWWRPRC